jgi:hypothetical protein
VDCRRVAWGLLPTDLAFCTAAANTLVVGLAWELNMKKPNGYEPFCINSGSGVVELELEVMSGAWQR